MDRLRNEQIRSNLPFKPLLREIEESSLTWYGHTKWMDDGRMAKRYLEWKPQGRRPVRRPRKRWLYEVEEAIERREVLLGDVEEERTYKNRDAWRDVVKCLPSDR